jgi:hypothetical protein
VGQSSFVAKTPPTSDTEGIAVLDVRDPAAPRLVSFLRTPGGAQSVETIDAVDAGKRKVLAVGAYGGRTTAEPLNEAIGPALDIYDVSGDCTEPIFKSTVYWPDTAHNVTVNPSGTRVYGTRYAPEAKATAATALNSSLDLGYVVAQSPIPLTNVMVIDISKLAAPRMIADAPLILPDGSPTLCHKVEFDKAETRMYCAGNQLSDRAVPDGREPPYTTWPDAGPSIWDVTDISQGKANPTIRFVGESAVKGQGGHHAVPARVGSRRYVVAANELAFTCDTAAYPRIWDITDEANPKVVSELHLAPPDECAGNHYNNVDDSERTTMALVGWLGAGFRVFDLRNPAQPREIAYFKPGTECYSEAFFDKPSGHLWYVCNGGFYVADLSPQVRAYMGLPKRPPAGSATGSQAWSPPPAAPAPTDPTTYAAFCWLGTAPPATPAP